MNHHAFRALNKKTMEMIVGRSIGHILNYPDPFLGNDIILMQFTGFHDKDGVEIYEGDIVSFWNGTLTQCENGSIEHPGDPNRRYERTENKLKQVIFSNQAFGVDGGPPLGSRYLESDNIEVVGNIYQNPELLSLIK